MPSTGTSTAISPTLLKVENRRKTRTFFDFDRAVHEQQMRGSPDLIAARSVAEHIGSDHFEYAFSAQDLADSLSHVIYHLESADVDLVRSAIPTLFAARLARRHVKAVLTGEGADELFAGYAYHHAMWTTPAPLPTS